MVPVQNQNLTSNEIHKLLSKVSVDSELNFYETDTGLLKKVLILVQEILKI